MRTPPSKRPSILRISALGLALALTAVACGSSDEDDTNAAAPVVTVAPAESATTEAASGSDGESAAAPTPDSVEQTDEEKAIAFADCMRGEGIDMPDPTVDAQGAVSFEGADGQVDPTSAAFDTAFDTCGDLLDGASFLPGAGLSETEQQDNLLAFAQCLRDQGYDVIDPDLSDIQGQGPGAFATLFGENFDPTDPANQAVVQLCQATFGAGQ